MSYPLAVSLIAAVIVAFLIWTGSLFFDYNLARQLLLAFIIPAIVYMAFDYKETFDA